jgi:hypothetical protein
MKELAIILDSCFCENNINRGDLEYYRNWAIWLGLYSCLGCNNGVLRGKVGHMDWTRIREDFAYKILKQKWGLVLVEQDLQNLIVTFLITATPWITGLYCSTDHMEFNFWHLDVGLSWP